MALSHASKMEQVVNLETLVTGAVMGPMTTMESNVVVNVFKIIQNASCFQLVVNAAVAISIGIRIPRN